MRVFRWGLVVVLAFYTLMAAMPWAFTLAHKAGAARPGASDAEMIGLMNATGGPVLIAWTAMVLLYAAGVLALARGRGRAWPLLTAAWVLDAGIVLVMQRTAAYQAAFGPAEQQMTWAFLAAAGLAVAAVGWLEGGPRGQASGRALA